MSGEYLANCVDELQKSLKLYGYLWNGLLINYVPKRDNQKAYADLVWSVKSVYEGIEKLISDFALFDVNERNADE